ncbi:hypothetical protein EJB05_38620 [Eragrostis curvula]|uniref:Uncharacterized protein n=1 Tax=Eragrostis curvula TaxID=38414 RepID=A0A5J9TVB3_9POAL|nr:hypothetical protein EJB05_38620 [Eragrostis curvula]
MAAAGYPNSLTDLDLDRDFAEEVVPPVMGIVMEAGRTILDGEGCAASRQISVAIDVIGATWIHIRCGVAN